jgi:probable HAF family extracellular repeat protein
MEPTTARRSLLYPALGNEVRLTLMRRSIFRNTFIALLGTLPLAVLCVSQDRYSVTDIGSLTGASTVAHKINASGHAAATSGQRDGGGAHAALWNHSTKTLRPSSILEDADYSEAATINNRDEMAGVCNSPTNMLAVFWSGTGEVRELGALPGDNSSRAFGINDQSKVVGLSSGPGGQRAFLWTAQNGMEAVTVPPDTQSSEAHGINNKDQIVGDFRGSNGTHAFLSTPKAGAEDLGVLPGYQTSKATGINDAGAVVGSSSGPTGTRAFIWTPKDGLEPINDVPGTEFSEALDINNHAEVVGTYEGSLGNRAFLWSKRDGFVDLNTLLPARSGLVLTMAMSINDQGQILAIGMAHPDISAEGKIDQDEASELHMVDVHSFLLTPRPPLSAR